jgi:hypothetical protein
VARRQQQDPRRVEAAPHPISKHDGWPDMKRALAALGILCGTSGCYTVIRHPVVERTASSTFYEEAPYALGPTQDCAACHDPWPGDGCGPWLPPYPPVWLAYSAGPWWERTGIQQTQAGSLVNARPRPALEPARPVFIDVPAGEFTGIVKPAPPGLGSQPITSPHPDPAPPVVHAPTPGGRDSDAASAPHTPADHAPPATDPRPQEAPATAAARDAAPVPGAAAVPPAHGASMLHSRPRPS